MFNIVYHNSSKIDSFCFSLFILLKLDPNKKAARKLSMLIFQAKGLRIGSYFTEVFIFFQQINHMSDLIFHCTSSDLKMVFAAGKDVYLNEPFIGFKNLKFSNRSLQVL